MSKRDDEPDYYSEPKDDAWDCRIMDSDGRKWSGVYWREDYDVKEALIVFSMSTADRDFVVTTHVADSGYPPWMRIGRRVWAAKPSEWEWRRGEVFLWRCAGMDNPAVQVERKTAFNEHYTILPKGEIDEAPEEASSALSETILMQAFKAHHMLQDQAAAYFEHAYGLTDAGEWQKAREKYLEAGVVFRALTVAFEEYERVCRGVADECERMMREKEGE